MGIGEKPPGWELADFVLAPFSKPDRELADDGIVRAAEAVRVILDEGVNAAMNRFNGKQMG